MTDPMSQLIAEIEEEEAMTTPAGLNVYAYGHDFGHAFMKGARMKGKKAVTSAFPTAIGEATYTSLVNTSTDFKTSPAIRVEGWNGEYVFGAVAEGMKTNWNGRGNMERYKSKYSPLAAMVNSALMIPDQEYGLVIATGLPAEPFIHIAGLKESIKEAMSGTYRFTMNGGKTWRTVHMECPIIMMEGAAVFFGLPKMQGTNIRRLCIDIGGRTTDVYSDIDGRTQPDLCKGTPIGMTTGYAALQNSFQSEYGEELAETEIRQIFDAYISEADKKPYPVIEVNGIVVSGAKLDVMARNALDDVSERLMTFLAQTLSPNDRTLSIGARYNQMLLAGGSAIFFEKSLKRRLPRLKLAQDPRHANVLGYLRAAEKVLEGRSPQALITLPKSSTKRRAKSESSSESASA